MSFDARESSRSLGEPVDLYRFTYNNPDFDDGVHTFCYTDAEASIVNDGLTYAPTPLDRTAIASSGSLDKAAITVSLPKETEVAELFRIFPPSDIVALTIFQGHFDDGEFIAIWSGRVLSCGRR